MCGIAGIYRYDSPGEISLNALRRMIAAQGYRGPDEAGFYLNHKIGLGHARLSIIDLSGGIQPIHNEDKTLWIIYNGEVYNYPELKNDLLKKGHRFYTTSDTEVLLHLYEEKRERCLQDFNGQFALAIWDERNQELFIARDRVGIRPVHFTRRNGSLLFASEIKSIFAAGETPAAIDSAAMDQVFTFWTTLPGKTVFKDIEELPPGCYIKASKNQFMIRRYWSPPFSRKEQCLTASPGEFREQAQDLLLDAVRIRLRADVPVGAYLSGGLDSSAVTTLIAKNFNQNVQTFGVRFEEKEFDESDYQDEMAVALGIQQRSLCATNEQIGAAFPDVVWHCEKPLLRTGPVPLYLLSGLVRSSNIKVVLTGEGADEVFGGYNIFREAKIRHFLSRQSDSPARLNLLGKLYPYIFDNPRAKQTMRSFFGRGLAQTGDPLFSHLIRWETTSRIKTFFSRALQADIQSSDGLEQVRRSLPPDFHQWDYLAKAQYLEMTIFLSNYLLSSQGDRVAMAHSVEIRLPYLDMRVIEFMGQVPARWKILGLNEKHLLKGVFRDVLPPRITQRAKQPYRSPIKAGLLNSVSQDYIREMLSESELKNSGLFDDRKVTALMGKIHKTDQPSEFDSMALAGIVSSQLIYRQYISNYTLPSPKLSCPQLVVDKRPKHDTRPVVRADFKGPRQN